MSRRIPEILIKFLEREEGVRNIPYADPGGVWTVGCGHTGPDVIPGQYWTQARIDATLEADLAFAVHKLQWAIGDESIAKLSDYQYAALLSFVFNVGAQHNWSVWGEIRQGRMLLVPAKLLAFDHVGGVEVKGLKNRRNAEIALWNGQDPLCREYPLKAA